MGVGRNSQQQAGADMIYICIACSTTGNGAANKNYIFTVGTVIFLAKASELWNGLGWALA